MDRREKLMGRKKKRTLPPARKCALLQDAIEEGLRGFLFNDMDSVGDAEVNPLVDRALNRILLAIDERFEF